MKRSSPLNISINHALTFRPQQPSHLIPIIEHYDILVEQPKKQFNPYKVPKYHNPLTERSRKHRLLEEKNVEIEKSNRLLYEKIRKIKMKNMYHSERKIESHVEDDQQPSFNNIHLNTNPITKIQNGLHLPHLPSHLKPSSRNSTSTISNKMLSMNSTKSCLNNILEDRTTFVEKYFNDLNANRNKKLQEKQIAVVSTENGWKVKVIMVGEESLLLVGKKGRNQMTKKYLYGKVKEKVENNLEEWVKLKFSFQL